MLGERAVFDLNRRWTASLDELQREMDRYLDHIAHRKPRQVVFSQRTWQPAVDLYETPSAVVALVDLSGVPQEDIDLVVTSDSVLIRGARKDVGKDEQRTYSRIEIPFGPFERMLRLPATISPEETSASYRYGFLEVVMPRARAAGPQRVTVSPQ
jgi:HSP20 family protein